MVGFWIALAWVALLGLAFVGRPYLAWVAGAASGLMAWAASGPASWAGWTVAALALAAAAGALGVPGWRRQWLTRRLMPVIAKLLPRLGDTERVALEAGTVGWDGELFSGAPDWSAFLAFQVGELSSAERAFLDGPVEDLCRQLDDWTITQTGDLPEEVWETLRKRYITLAPVATLIGLAFRMRDPDGLLGGEEDLGITCALVPVDRPGVEIGTRHDPMGVPFQNGPTTGEDVFLPLDAIIGGRDGAGRGWQMLMECLSAGRSISLPSVSVAGTKLATRAASAYAMVREQFDTPIGRFEGVEEPLSRMAGLTYATDATRSLTAAAVDAGEKPAVLSAIAKAYCTEAMRTVVNDAMDIRAGAAIMRGPRNILGRIYTTIPIGITVEGANILTRSMIIYGQGAIRCHPFALAEMNAVEADDLDEFDRAFFGHLGFVATTAARSLVLGLSRGRLERSVPGGALTRRTCQRLSRASAAFALVSDGAMATLGGRLKRREKITGRLADALAWLYMGSAVIKRFHDSGEPDSQRAIARWACDHALAQVDAALAGVLRNLPARPAAWLLAPLVFPLGRRERGPDDALGSAVARALLDDDDTRGQLTAGIFVPPPEEAGLGRLEAALEEAKPALAVEARIRAAVADGRVDRAPGDALVAAALAAGIITGDDAAQLKSADAAREEAIQVDAFDPTEYAALRR